jgi:hypothetical protein
MTQAFGTVREMKQRVWENLLVAVRTNANALLHFPADYPNDLSS